MGNFIDGLHQDWPILLAIGIMWLAGGKIAAGGAFVGGIIGFMLRNPLDSLQMDNWQGSILGLWFSTAGGLKMVGGIVAGGIIGGFIANQVKPTQKDSEGKE